MPTLTLSGIMTGYVCENVQCNTIHINQATLGAIIIPFVKIMAFKQINCPLGGGKNVFMWLSITDGYLGFFSGRKLIERIYNYKLP